MASNYSIYLYSYFYTYVILKKKTPLKNGAFFYLSYYYSLITGSFKPSFAITFLVMS